MEARIALLPGDGIGPEVTAAGRAILEAVARRRGHPLTFEEAPIGGAGLEASGEPLPPATLELCLRSQGVLLGAVGGPRWESSEKRPEQGLLALRRELALFANLRPVRAVEATFSVSPLKDERLRGTDLLIVRELTGGIYFGPRREQDAGRDAYDTMLYSVDEVERVAHVAFRAAAARRGRVTSVDKANVLASMRLWRRTVDKVAAAYPEVELRHLLVDACAMEILRAPGSFDVLLTPNLFGDILSDEAAVLAGSLGMLPSASLGSGGPGLFEPVHGSAPELAGRGIANPIGAILAAAMLLRHGLGLEDEAAEVERAAEASLAEGVVTADLVGAGAPAASTDEVTEAVLARLEGPGLSRDRSAARPSLPGRLSQPG